MLDLIEVADFVALAEARSFSRAAQLRHITQPAFSRRIQQLEQRLKVVLVDRSRTPLALTPAGQRFLQHAQALLAGASGAEQDMHQLATHLPDALHIETGRSLANSFFPLWYRGLQRQVKGLSFRLTHARSRRSLDNLRAGLTDFAIQGMVPGFDRQEDYSGIERTVIGHDRLLFVKAASAGKDSTSLITHRPDSYLHACFEKMVPAARRARMKLVFEGPASEFIRSMVLAGFGAALLQESLIADDLKDGYIIPAQPGIKPLPLEIMLLRAAGKHGAKAEAVWRAAS